MEPGTFTFADELKRQPLDLPRAALRLAHEIAYPRLDVASYLARLDLLADWARAVVRPDEPVGKRARDLAGFLFRELGFEGDSANYQDPRNSYLNEVLERRLGIPISLAAVYLAIAQRLAIPAQGVGLPGHFIVRVDTALGALFLDPFRNGERLDRADCARLVQRSTGYDGPFEEAWLQPVPPEQMLTRMLTNLKIIYVQQRAWEPALATIERLRELQPAAPEHMRDLGLLYYQNDQLRQAARFLEMYLLRSPDAADAEDTLKYLQAATERLAYLN